MKRSPAPPDVASQRRNGPETPNGAIDVGVAAATVLQGRLRHTVTQKSMRIIDRCSVADGNPRPYAGAAP